MTVEVIQSDRDAAVSYASDYLNWSGFMRIAVRTGKRDDHPLVQAFARHRATNGGDHA